MNKYYSSRDKRFNQMVGILVMITVFLLPAMLIVNDALIAGKMWLTLLLCGVLDCIIIFYVIKISKMFYYAPDKEKNILFVGTPSGLQEIDMNNVKKVEHIANANSVCRVGYGNSGILIVFENNEKLSITPKEKEGEELFKMLRSMMGGNRR